MLVLDYEQHTRESITAHYDALCVELLGVRGAGLPRERIAELIESGHLSPAALEGLDVGDLDEPLNPLLFVRLIGTPYLEATPRTRALMRDYTLDQWRRELEQPFNVRLNEPPTETGWEPPLYINRPEPPELPHTPHPAPLPVWISEAEKAGLVSAYKTAGQYIRGLGATLADEASGIIFEEWGGEQIISTPDPQRRAAALEAIREEVGAAVLTHETAQTLATRMRQRTADLARNFERIALTELQSAHNEGQIYQALYVDGEGARVARIPESGACKHCLRLFTRPDGRPRVFDVEELVSYGSNVGRAARDYVPSAYPIHPQCRCDTIPIRAGQDIDAQGRLTRAEGEP